MKKENPMNNSKMPLSETYEFLDLVGFGEHDDQVTPIKIIKGKYEGLVYCYGKTRFLEEDNNLRCNFTYEIIENPKNFIEDKELIDMMGEILIEILEFKMNQDEDFLQEIGIEDLTEKQE